MPLIIHTDRGCQYVSEAWRQATEGMTCSYSHTGYPYDNACIESFHSLIKREWLNRFNVITPLIFFLHFIIHSAVCLYYLLIKNMFTFYFCNCSRLCLFLLQINFSKNSLDETLLINNQKCFK